MQSAYKNATLWFQRDVLAKQMGDIAKDLALMGVLNTGSNIAIYSAQVSEGRAEPERELLTEEALQEALDKVFGEFRGFLGSRDWVPSQGGQ